MRRLDLPQRGPDRSLRRLGLRGDRPSRTALRVALSRAAHQALDEPRILDDPLAMRIVGASAARQLLAEPQSYQALPARYLRGFLVARSRVAEDTLAGAVARGVRQYVVLGAGLDTFAYRNPHTALRVFEVDYPATQAWKKQHLAQADIAIPDSLIYVPVDFDTQSLTDSLYAAGLRPTPRRSSPGSGSPCTSRAARPMPLSGTWRRSRPAATSCSATRPRSRR